MNESYDDVENRYQKVVENLSNMYKIYDTDLKLSQIARMASISSAIKKEFHEFSFVGFYIVVTKENNEKYLEIGPYVSDILATPRIGYGRGVCGTTWEKKESIIINNVKKCNNYIACSPEVKSEIVVPVLQKDSNEVVAVLDIDSTILERFSEVDRNKLEYIISTFS